MNARMKLAMLSTISLGLSGYSQRGSLSSYTHPRNMAARRKKRRKMQRESRKINRRVAKR